MSTTIHGYSSKDSPTVKEFFASDAFVRGLQGPFGCLSGDTEFLTPGGWKRMDAYVPGDLVAQWDESGVIQFVEPSEYINLPTDFLIEFDSGSLKMAVSPEHRIPHYNWTGRFQVKTAAQVASHPSRRTIPTTFLAPSESGLPLSDDMIRFAVMMQADGHYVPKGHQAVVCVRKDRKKARVREILGALDIPYDERNTDARPTETCFVFYPPYRSKVFGPEWYQASRRQLEIVMDEMEHWDGLHDHAECRYFSNDKRNVDFIQYAAHATGFRAGISCKVYPDKDWKPTYIAFIRVGDSCKNHAQIREHTRIEVIPAKDGRKYCFSVPSTFFVARYQDTIFITGNSGKSSACVWEIIRRGVKQAPGPDGVRRSRWVAIRNTVAQLNDTTIKTFMQWLPPHQFGLWQPSYHRYLINKITHDPKEPPAEIEILFRALDRPDQVSNLLSLELTGAWINEAREIQWPIVEAVQGRVGRYPAIRDGGPTWSGVIMDTNPPDTDSDWFRFFEETDHSEAVEALAKVMPGMTVDKYRKVFKQPSGLSAMAENKANLKPGYYEQLAVGKSKEWVKVYIHGDYGFTVDGKPIFGDDYEDDFHCKEMFAIEDLPIYRGWDFGLTPACVFSQITPAGQWIVLDEMVSKSMGIDRFSDDVVQFSNRAYPQMEFIDIGDPAGSHRAQTDEKTCFQILRAKGILIEPGLQDPTIRWESVRKPLQTLISKGRPQFLLHPRCKTLRKGFMGGYQFRRLMTSGERYADVADKNSFSHVHDALGYVATRLFGPALRTPKVKDDEYARDYRAMSHATRSSVTGY